MKEKVHLFKVDILRGIAILSVFAYHAQLCFFPHFEVNDSSPSGLINITSTRELILNFSPAAFGNSGVQLFLIISGFLIHLGFLYADERFQFSGFISKRFWRIYPPYLLVLLFLCFFNDGLHYYIGTRDGIEHLLSHLFLVHNLSDKTFFSINPSFWSLALEMQLYFLYPVLLMVRRKAGIRNTALTLCGLSLLLIITGLVFNGLGKCLPYTVSALTYWFIWALGALLAEKFYKGERIFKSKALLLFFAFVLAAILSKANIYSRNFTVYFTTLAWLAFFEWFLHKESRESRFIYKAIATIGICSYSLYLIHQPYLKNLVEYLSLSNKGYLGAYFQYLYIIPVFVILFLISYSLYLFVEVPAIRFGKRLRSRLNLTSGATER